MNLGTLVPIPGSHFKFMKLSEAIAGVRDSLTSGGVLQAAEFIYRNIVSEEPDSDVRINEESANRTVLQYVQFLLNEGRYLEAAKILWPETTFNCDPDSVKAIWDEIPKNSELYIMGAGSLGKSYSIAAWIVLDWLRDPDWTCFKVISVTKEHAKRNIYAHIKNLHANASIKLPGVVNDSSIQSNEDDKQGIHLVTIPQGDEGKGRLRGFHPVPRLVKHETFGGLSRIRVILDEAEEIPGGVWEGVDNIMITRDGVDAVKVIAATNPKDIHTRFGQRAEPKEGWTSVDIETANKWLNKKSRVVLRLDGALCENVVQRKMVFPGLLTWEGYAGYLGDDGENMPLEYYTMARGWYPPQGLEISAIPFDYIERAKGAFIFQGKVTWCSSTDLAFEGNDRVIMTVGRFGRVTGYTDANGKVFMFDTGVPRFGLQLERQIDLPKLKTLEQTDQLIGVWKSLNIPAAWNIVDRTGNGTGVHDTAQTKYGLEVMGLHFGSGSTDKYILDDESVKASELYDGVVTELFFAMRKYIEFHYVKFGPGLDTSKLGQELTSRKYKQVKQKMVRIESKKEYKARGFKSPDYADSATMIVHLVRMQSDFVARMLPEGESQERAPMQKGIVDSIPFLSLED